MSWLNRFLMSLAATTVSIVLTFGTTVILDRKKQKEEKREMVMRTSSATDPSICWYRFPSLTIPPRPRASMKLDFEQCMQMMKVSDKDLDIFSKGWRKLLESSENPSLAVETERFINERNQRVLQMQQARKEGRESLE